MVPEPHAYPRLAALIVAGVVGLVMTACRTVPDGEKGNDREYERRTVAVEMRAPDAGWDLDIEEAYLVDGDIWLIVRLDRRSGPAAQMVTTVSDSATIRAPEDADVRVYVLGKTWNWGDEPYTILDSRDVIENRLDDAREIDVD